MNLETVIHAQDYYECLVLASGVFNGRYNQYPRDGPDPVRYLEMKLTSPTLLTMEEKGDTHPLVQFLLEHKIPYNRFDRQCLESVRFDSRGVAYSQVTFPPRDHYYTDIQATADTYLEDEVLPAWGGQEALGEIPIKPLTPEEATLIMKYKMEDSNGST